MTAATAARPAKTARKFRVRWNATVGDKTVVAVTVTDKGRADDYHATHAEGSCEVRWTHADDATRSYTVTCSAVDGEAFACTCPARRSVVCKHRAMTAKLVGCGLIDMPTVLDECHERYEDDDRDEAARDYYRQCELMDSFRVAG